MRGSILNTQSVFIRASTQQLLPPPQLLRHFLRAGGAGEITFGHRALEIEDGQRIALEGLIHGLQVGEREFVERFARAFGQRHHRAHHVMGFAERHAFLHEVISEVGREQRGIARGGQAGEGIHAGVQQHGAHQPHASAHGVGGVEQSFLVLLQIAIVGHGQPLEQREQRHEVAIHAPGLAARQLGHVGIFLLRHERRAGGVGVGDLDEVELRAGPENHVLREPRQMHGEHRTGGAEFDGEIAVAHGVHGVLRDLNLAIGVHEAKQLGDKHAIKLQG